MENEGIVVALVVLEEPSSEEWACASSFSAFLYGNIGGDTMVPSPRREFVSG